MTTMQPSGLTVLLVEDNPDHAALAGRALHQLGPGTAVMIAPTPEGAIELCTGGPAPALLVIDYSLPRMNGLDLIGELRQAGIVSPVILITALGSEDVAAAALRAGVSDYVSKGELFWELLPEVARRVLHRFEISRRLQSLDSLILEIAAAPNAGEMARRIAAGGRALLDGAGGAVWCDQSAPRSAFEGPKGAALRLVGETAIVEDDPGGVRWQVVVRRLESERARTMGVLAVCCERAERLPEEERVLNVFARFAGTALDNAMLLEFERARAEALEEVDRLKSEFIATVTHELLTPLTVVEGFGETMLAMWDRLPDSQRRDYVSRQLAHARDLSSLIHRVLEFSRLERLAPATPEEVTIAEELACIDGLRGSHRIVRRLGAERALVPRESLRSILTNLVSNALKYAPGETPVEIWALSAGDSVIIGVDDRGPGVREDETSEIFQPFVRGAGSVAARGTGIGLAVVATHVRACGGEVWVEAREGGGASFRVKLPGVAAGVAHPTKSMAR